MRTFALLLVCSLFCACSRQSEPGASRGADERSPDSYRVHFETTKGDVVIEVTRSWAPLGADRFYTLVKSGFFDGARFFRVVPGFIVQFGIAADPALNEKWKNANLKDDPFTQSNRRGTVTFATGGRDTRTTQLFINLVDNARLDKDFAPIGAVTSGMDVVGQFYSGYGEDPGMGGHGPAQSRLESEGNAYVERDFPKLDYIKKATIEK
jgi:peptidyl-prolyl cis-trans isomerase A (cyclophilin A)